MYISLDHTVHVCSYVCKQLHTYTHLVTMETGNFEVVLFCLVSLHMGDRLRQVFGGVWQSYSLLMSSVKRTFCFDLMLTVLFESVQFLCDAESLCLLIARHYNLLWKRYCVSSAYQKRSLQQIKVIRAGLEVAQRYYECVYLLASTRRIWTSDST